MGRTHRACRAGKATGLHAACPARFRRQMAATARHRKARLGHRVCRTGAKARLFGAFVARVRRANGYRVMNETIFKAKRATIAVP